MARTMDLHGGDERNFCQARIRTDLSAKIRTKIRVAADSALDASVRQNGTNSAASPS
jgi:hypothetical protein